MAILIEYDLVAEESPLSSIMVRLMVYSPGSRKVWLTEETLYTGSSKSEISHLVCSSAVSPSGSNDSLTNV